MARTPALRRDEEQRRPLHQVEFQAGKVMEARPRHEGGGIEARAPDQRRRPRTPPVMARHSAPSPSPKRSSPIAPPKRGLERAGDDRGIGQLHARDGTIGRLGIAGEHRLRQRLQPGDRRAALVRGGVGHVVEHPHAHPRIDDLVEEFDEKDVAGEPRQVAQHVQLAPERILPLVSLHGADDAAHALVQRRRVGPAGERRGPRHRAADDQRGIEIVACVVEREGRHDAGPVRQELHQPFARKQEQGLADRRARNLEAGGEVALVERRARRDAHPEDFLAQHVMDLQRAAAPALACLCLGLRCHATMIRRAIRAFGGLALCCRENVWGSAQTTPLRRWCSSGVAGVHRRQQAPGWVATTGRLPRCGPKSASAERVYIFILRGGRAAGHESFA